MPFIEGSSGGTSPVTTKGDLFGYSTQAARIPVGADGTILTADSTQALGLKWGTAAALQLITNTVLGADGTFTFSTIPATYNHLLLFGRVRLKNATLLDNLQLRLNNDSGANQYLSQQVSGSTTTASAAESLGATSATVARFPANTATANYMGAFAMFIPAYSIASGFKQVLCLSYGPGDTGSGDQIMRMQGVLYVSTSAVSQIDLFGATTANCASGSSVSLYGLT